MNELEDMVKTVDMFLCLHDRLSTAARSTLEARPHFNLMV